MRHKFAPIPKSPNTAFASRARRTRPTTCAARRLPRRGIEPTFIIPTYLLRRGTRHLAFNTFDLLSISTGNVDLTPGKPLELTIAKGTPPYTITVGPKPTALAITQPTPTTAILLAEAAPDQVANLFVTVTDSSTPKLKGGRHLALQTMPPYLAPNLSADYLDYVRPPTFGLATPLLNGRSSNGPNPDIDLTEPLDAMARAVSALGAGDTVYLAAWLFEAATPLSVGGIAGVTTWGALFANKAAADVKIRILLNDFDPISGMDALLKNLALDPLDALIAALPAAKRDNLKYVVSLHAAFVGSFKAFFAGQGARNIHVASHHQKFMVVRRGDSLTAFCGGVDIESRKTPTEWKYTPRPNGSILIGWHDIHVQLEGPVTRDLEREFVARWNRERGASTRPARPGWAALEQLAETPLSPADDTAARKVHSMQMIRTVSIDGGSSLFETKRKDVFEAYRKAIGQAKSFIYMENQYFRSTALADAIAAAGKANPALVLIMVVVASAADDDGDNAITQHGNFLQFETYDRISKAFAGRSGFYSMTNRAVHSKFVMVDDLWMTIGSANANGRSFELDSELNLQIGENPLSKAFRARLWAHNLGVPIATAGGWKPGNFLAEWNAVAIANRGLDAKAMAGEGVIPFDYAAAKGKSHGSLPDALVDLEFGSGNKDSDRVA